MSRKASAGNDPVAGNSEYNLSALRQKGPDSRAIPRVKKMKTAKSCLMTFVILLLSASISLAQEKCDAVYGNGKNKFSLAREAPENSAY